MCEDFLSGISLFLSLSKGRKGKKLSLQKLFFEREREWPSRSKSPPFLQSGDDLSSFNGVANTPTLLFCWIIIVIICFSCFGLSGESMGLWIFHDVEFLLNDSIHAGFLRREVIRGCGSEVKLIFTFLLNWFMVSFCLMILLIGFYFILIMYFILPFEIVKLLPFLWLDCAFVFVVSLQLINSTDTSFDI